MSMRFNPFQLVYNREGFAVEKVLPTPGVRVSYNTLALA
jgi:hypothetical protein